MTADDCDLNAAGRRSEALTAQYRTGDNLRARVDLYQYLHPEKALEPGFEPWVLDHRHWHGR